MARNEPPRKGTTYTRSTRELPPIKAGVPYEAVVVNNLDVNTMGTLEVELLNYTSAGNLPERSGQLETVRYLSPFYGATPSAGLTENDGYEYTQKSYGFWAVPPDVGTKCLVIFAEGNKNFGYWIGCIQDDYMNFMIPDGRAATSLTTENTPEHLKGAKLPVGEYNKLVETGEKVDPTLFNKPYNKDFTQVLEVQGLLLDEARGTTTSSARRDFPSMVFGWSTPGPRDKRKKSPKFEIGPDGKKVELPYNRLGGSSIVMDDGDERFVRETHAEDGPPRYVNKGANYPGGDETIPQNELFRIRTRTGHQILLHNSEDLIYISNSRGTAWIELTSDGKIDIHADDSISVMSNQDINFTAERDFNIDAGRNINMRAQARYSDGQKTYDGLECGRIQIESKYDTNILVGETYRRNVLGTSNIKVEEDEYVSIKGNYHKTSGNIFDTSKGGFHQKSAHTFYRESASNINDLATGSYFNKAEGINLTSLADTKILSAANFDTITQGAQHTTVSGAFDIQSDSQHFEAASGINMLGGTAIAGDATKISWNTGKAVAGEAATTALSATAATEAKPADYVTPLTQIVLPYTFPGSQDTVPYESILTRAPQHEPWPMHENMDPVGLKPEQTDRESPGQLSPSDRILTPDTFTKSKSNIQQSSQVLGSSGTNDYGTTGDGAIINGEVVPPENVPGSNELRYIENFEIDTTRGDGSYCNRFFKGDGPLGTITSKKRGLTAQVAEIWVPNFQGFIDALEDSGYEIKTLLGYCKRKIGNSSRYSTHASGAAIDINPPNPVRNTSPNGLLSPRPPDAPKTDMPAGVGELAKQFGLGWGGAWTRIDDAMHFSTAANEGGNYRFPAGIIPQGPSTDTQVHTEGDPRGRDYYIAPSKELSEEEEQESPTTPENTNNPGPQNSDGTSNVQ